MIGGFLSNGIMVRHGFTRWTVLVLSFCWICSHGDVTEDAKEQIMKSKEDVERILGHILDGSGKTQAYDRTAELVDKFGQRFTGSDSLEQSIDWMKTELEREGFDNVHTEEVDVPIWRRGREKVYLLSPRFTEMYIMSSFMAPAGNVTGEAILIRSFEELDEKQAQVAGKIVVYNQVWTDYLGGFRFRTEGARRASAYGAIAALVRSVTQFSIYSPHTGSNYFGEETPIPTGCIATEDADMLQRMQDRGDRIEINVDMEHEIPATTGKSRNLVADITGSEFPDQYVLFGGHIDSWDVGVGAMDDAGGVMVTRQILTTIKRLGLTPRRTMRLVIWTAEEIGVVGANQYYEAHQDLTSKISFALESDYGTFDARGLGLHYISEAAFDIIHEIMRTYLADRNMASAELGGLGKADIDPFMKEGVPGASLATHNDMYFYFHHTEGDRMTVQDPQQMDRCAALVTVVMYVVANMDEMLPRGPLKVDGPPDPGAAYAIRPLNIWLMLLFVIALKLVTKKV